MVIPRTMTEEGADVHQLIDKAITPEIRLVDPLHNKLKLQIFLNSSSPFGSREDRVTITVSLRNAALDNDLCVRE